MPAPPHLLATLARRLAWPGLILVVALTVAGAFAPLVAVLGLDPSGAMVARARVVVHAIAWFAAAACVVRTIDVVVWQGVVEARSGVPVPRLLRNLVAGVVWLVAAMIALAGLIAIPVAGLVTTSGVTIAVVGFALRDMIASLFSGIAINLERPYRIGDWIEVQPGVVGKVMEINWLTTRTATRDGIGVVVPNVQLATAPFRNYNQPGAAWRDSFAITLDHALPPERVERILLAAMNAVPAVAAQVSPPDVKIEAVTEWGIRWLARYWVSDYGAMPETRHAVQRSVLHHLHHAGIAIPYPRRDLFVGLMPERALDHRRHLDGLLARSELFANLAADELRRLAEAAERHHCPAGVPIVRAGERGGSLFVVVEGLLQVRRAGADGREREVDRLTPGDAFGEFSLLTGAPRSATVVPQGDAVVYEITKAALAPILEHRPDLAERLGWILAQRQLRRQGQLARAGGGPRPAPPTPHLWLERVRAFFGLGDDRRSS